MANIMVSKVRFGPNLLILVSTTKTRRIGVCILKNEYTYVCMLLLLLLLVCIFNFMRMWKQFLVSGVNFLNVLIWALMTPPSSFLYIHHQVTDLHRHKIDHIAIPSSRGPEFGVLKRVEDVRPLNPCFSIMFLYLHSHFKSIYTFLPWVLLFGCFLAHLHDHKLGE